MRFDENILTDSYGNVIIRVFHSSGFMGKRPYREHHHTECELSVFLSGRGIYTVNGRSYEFEAGDMFLFGSDEAHCITEIFEQIDLLNIHFEPRLLWEDSYNIELLKLFNARNEKFSNKFPHSDVELHRILSDIELEMDAKLTGYALKVKCAILSAFVYILRNYDYVRSDEGAIRTSSVTKNLKKAMRYIDENLENQLDLKSISAVACMAPTYFSSVFKKFNGISPWDYITIKRVERAIEMLKNTDMTKLEIAEKCGFVSSSNFYKMFTKVTGKKPGDYSAAKNSLK